MKTFFKIKYIFLFIVGFLFSLCLLLTFEINYNGNFPNNFINEFYFDFLFFIKTFILSIFTTIIFYLLFKLIDKIKVNKTNKFLSSKKTFIISFICLLISGLLFLITYYPGNIMIDTLYIFKDPVGTSSQHPIVYIWLVTIPFKIFLKLFSNIDIALFLTCTLQLIIFSFIISIIVTWFNKKFKNKIFTITLILYFTFIPILTNYNTTLIKDSVFCIVMLCLIPIIYEIINSNCKWITKRKNFIITIIFFSALCLIRNNGIYIILMLLILLIIIYKKQFKHLIFISIIIIVFSFIPKLFSNKQLFQEKIGIPLQQIAYVIRTNGNISKRDKIYLNKIYDYNSYKNNYNPFIVDTIKWDMNFNREYLNNTSNKFIKTWLNILPNNFESYVKSYLLSTYGNWSLDKFYKTQSNFLGINDAIENNPNLFLNLKSKESPLSFLKTFYNKTSLFLSGGVCFWVLAFVSSYIIYKEKYKLLLLTIPLYGTWLSLMIATPFSLAFRYMSPFMYLLPFIISITIIKTREN